VSEKFEAWGIVELMGHQRIAGRISEQVIGSGNLLRVDVPDGEEQFRTVFYGSSAIYALHVTDEAAARAACKGMGTRPAYAWELERLQKLPSAPTYSSPSREHDDDGGDYQDDIPL
jgi:hypothetical protein